MKIDPIITARAQAWLDAPIDALTKSEIQQMMDKPEALTEAFYTDLEFGTGGMRGIMGAGTNRINRYTIGMATQGLSNYLHKAFPNEKISVAIAYDSRNQSPEFARFTAEVFAANNIEVQLFEALRPTPELSFAVRELGCKSGIVITASHNPKAYNGYKVYWEDGAQIVAPHDKGIIAEVRAIRSLSEIKMQAEPKKIHLIGEEIDRAYLEKAVSLVLSPAVIQSQKNHGIVYTSLHGTGITLIPQLLKKAGFENLHIVKPQDEPNGDFPTVASPNPEEQEALQMGVDMAYKQNADIVLGTDPDTDRVGIAVRDHKGDFQLLNGNQTGTLLVYYCLLRWQELGKLSGREFVAKTIVTTELIQAIGQGFKVPVYDTLTGFKYIAAKIRELEGKEQFIAGGEESFGYLAGDFVRDKDAVISALLLCEISAWCKNQGLTMLDMLQKIYLDFGFYLERLISLKKEGKAGKEAIDAMMEGFRHRSPDSLGGEKVVRMDDLRSGHSLNLLTGESTSIDLPSSNVIQFFTAQGSKITARPSGTEPKIKFYISVNQTLPDEASFKQTESQLIAQLDRIEKDLLAR